MTIDELPGMNEWAQRVKLFSISIAYLIKKTHKFCSYMTTVQVYTNALFLLLQWQQDKNGKETRLKTEGKSGRVHRGR